MSTFMSHRNAQSYSAGRFVKEARGQMSTKRKAERKLERFVFAMVVTLSGMACWTAADTLPSIVVAGGAPTHVTA